jgi:uncharacterized SAM-binding protein YcdF (DUF218 family)
LSTAEVITKLLPDPFSRAWRAVYLATIIAPAVWLAAGLDIPAMLVAPLERRFERAEILDAEGLKGIIALGGGEERMREAGRLARRYPHLRVFISGDASDVLEWLGGDIDPARVVIETQSRNTYQNAVLSKAALRPKPGERWLLVTSASHMPRAMGTFRQNSFPVEPWPVYDQGGGHPAYEIAGREWLGLIAYRLLGRSSALFPAPTREPRVALGNGGAPVRARILGNLPQLWGKETEPHGSWSRSKRRCEVKYDRGRLHGKEAFAARQKCSFISG